ncbi:MAG TPA: DUF898 family protein [Alphaproteobacteria bacterium]|nr:DUF898 family protein [Alphaproteobacteria bacterium]
MDVSTETLAARPCLAQVGRHRMLALIALKNLLLNLLTLTIYRFWGKTRVRQYLWGTTCFLGDPLEYTGTGAELFIAFLFVMFAVLLPLGFVTQILPQLLSPDHLLVKAIPIVSFPVIVWLIGLAIYRAWRYRLTRTRWRGIRAGLTGAGWRFGLLYLGFYLLLLLTLGLTYPWMQVRLFGRMMRETVLGSEGFRFEASALPLYVPFLLSLLLTALLFVALAILGVVTMPFLGGVMVLLAGDDVGQDPVRLFILGVAFYAVVLVLLPPLLALSFSVYKARELMVLAEGIRFQDARFAFDVRARDVIRLHVGNWVILFLTLGFGLPLTQLRNFRFLCNGLRLIGEVDAAAIGQAKGWVPGVGEGLAEAFDLGAV